MLRSSFCLAFVLIIETCFCVPTSAPNNRTTRAEDSDATTKSDPGRWCPKNMLQCKQGPCISMSVRCDGHLDCPSGDDEDNCPKLEGISFCEGDEWRCESTGRCVPLSWACDGMKDCTDGSDELYCNDGQLLPDHSAYLGNRLTECTKGQFTCGHENKCIDRKDICNGVSDCKDGSDEGGLCSQCQTYGCQHECLASPLGAECTCPRGMVLAEDERACRDVDECTDGVARCDQVCTNDQGGYSCSCVSGYNLHDDGHQCVLEQSDVGLLLVSYSHMVRSLPLKYTPSGQEDHIRLLDGSNIHGDIKSLDYNSVDSHLYLAVPEDGAQFGRVYTLGHSLTCLLDNLPGLANIAVDWVTGNIYYALGSPSEQQGVGVCGSDGRFCRQLVTGIDLHRIDGLALHPRRGLMFWSVWSREAHSRIQMAHMDGEEQRVLVQDKLVWPNGLTVDYTTDQIYFADAQLGLIERIHLFTSVREIVVSLGAHHPFDLVVFDRHLLWTDWTNDALLSIDLRLVNETERTLLTSFDTLPFSVTVNHPAYQDPNIENPCLDSGCSHMCLLHHLGPESERPGFTCVCPEGYQSLHSNQTGDFQNDTESYCVPMPQDRFDRNLIPRLCFDTMVELCADNSACGEGRCVFPVDDAKHMRCDCPSHLVGDFCEVDTSVLHSHAPPTEPKKKSGGGGLGWVSAFFIVCTILLALGVLIAVYIRKTGIHKKSGHRPLFAKWSFAMPTVLYLQKRDRVAPEQQLIVPNEGRWEIDSNDSFSNPLYCDRYEATKPHQPLLSHVAVKQKERPYYDNVPLNDNDSGISATSAGTATP